MTNHPSEGEQWDADMNPEDYSEGLRVLLEVLDPVLHDQEDKEAMQSVLHLLAGDPTLLKRTIDMFASLIMMISLADGHERPCGYLHHIVSVYKEKLAELT